MALDYGLADRQSHAEASGFGGIERFKDTMEVRCTNPNTSVTHTHFHMSLRLFVLNIGADDDYPPFRCNISRGFRSVDQQVEKHLLQLDRVARDQRQLRGG